MTEMKMWREPALAMHTHGWIGKAFWLRGFVWNESKRCKYNLKVSTERKISAGYRKNKWLLLFSKSNQRERQCIRKYSVCTHSPCIFLCTVTATDMSWACLLCCLPLTSYACPDAQRSVALGTSSARFSNNFFNKLRQPELNWLMWIYISSV